MLRNDLRRTPIEERKRALAKLLRRASWALQFNDHIAEPGDIGWRFDARLKATQKKNNEIALRAMKEGLTQPCPSSRLKVHEGNLVLL
jgi:hypothetical protein